MMKKLAIPALILPHLGWLGALLLAAATVLDAVANHAGIETIHTRYRQYQTSLTLLQLHSLTLIILFVVARCLELKPAAKAAISLAAWLFIGGMAFFCGIAMYRMFSEVFFASPLVPLGGSMFIFGWLSLAVGLWFARR